MQFDRMELADIGNPRLMAAAVLKQLPSIEYPIAVEDIALALEVQRIVDFDTTAFEGALLADSAKTTCVILVREGTHPNRRRFTVGHELGHYLLPLHIPTGDGFRCSSADMRLQEGAGRGFPAKEIEANIFAAELLMPPAAFKGQLRSRRDVTLELLLETSAHFGVSLTACARRALQLADDTCAVIVSCNRVVESVYRAKEFPFIGLQRRARLPRASLSQTFVGLPGDVSTVDEADPLDWGIRARQGMTFYEQALLQSNGWQVTLLVLEDDEED